MMQAIEFRTKIRNGRIEIPIEYWQRLEEQGGENTVRVIIVTSERQPSDDYIDQLLANPIKINDFAPLARDELYERS
jgi:hypothetical protein